MGKLGKIEGYKKNIILPSTKTKSSIEARLLLRKELGKVKRWLILCLLIVIAAGCGRPDETSQPSIFLIPEGYKGWVMVEYDKDNGNPSKTEGDYTVFKVNDQGVGKTKTLLSGGGWARNKYFYVNKNGERKQLKQGKMIHGTTQGNKNHTVTYFFVGTAKEFDKAGDYRRKLTEESSS